MTYDKPGEEKSEVNEPAQTYGSMAGKKVRIFNSFKEQEDEMISYWASITPFQRLAHLYEMIKISFRITEADARRIHHAGKIKIIKYEP